MDKIKKYLPLGAAIAGALALILFIACPGIAYDAMGSKDSLSGWETAFGKDCGYSKLKGSFWVVLTMLFLIGATVCSVLAYLKAENKIFTYVAAACFALAIIFLFSTKGFWLTANDAKEAADYYKLGAGSIIGAILSILGLGAVAVPVVLKK